MMARSVVVVAPETATRSGEITGGGGSSRSITRWNVVAGTCEPASVRSQFEAVAVPSWAV